MSLYRIKCNVKDRLYERCGKCPYYYWDRDYWGECDEGCTKYGYKYEHQFCPYLLLPMIVVKVIKAVDEYISSIKQKAFERKMKGMCKKCKYKNDDGHDCDWYNCAIERMKRNVKR